MPRRRHLRARVLFLTAVFSIVLFAITFGLSWRARLAQERWSRIIAIETKAIATLEELVRAQNGFRARLRGTGETAGSPLRYRVVTQLLERDEIARIDARRLRARVRAFAEVLGDPEPRDEDLDATSAAIVRDAQALIEERKRAIARQLPALERDAGDMMLAGLAVAWIVMIIGFAVAQTTLRKVVRPLEELSAAADAIASGDLGARAPIAGDHEIAGLGVAFNRMADELKARARTDELTALPNFRAFRERLDAELERAERYPSRAGILVLDLDRFKQYNDRFGHAAGNEALQRVARVLRDAVRSVDFPARYGGEEFAVIAPEVDGKSLRMVAERIRSAIETLPAPPNGAAITASIGAAIFPDDGAAAADLFRIADQRLYEAKHAGRNRVVGPPATLPQSAEAAR